MKIEDLQNEKAIAYCRVSTKKQDKEGWSLDAQQDRIINSCRRHGIRLDKKDIYEEVKSARVTGRDKFNDVCDKLEVELHKKNGKRLLVATTLDRLYRNVDDQYKIHKLVEKGLIIVIFNDNIVFHKDVETNTYSTFLNLSREAVVYSKKTFRCRKR